ncbi:hypothetical protein ACU8KH_01017 [Lachancea thermotolerans]
MTFQKLVAFLPSSLRVLKHLDFEAASTQNLRPKSRAVALSNYLSLLKVSAELTHLVFVCPGSRFQFNHYDQCWVCIAHIQLHSHDLWWRDILNINCSDKFSFDLNSQLKLEDCPLDRPT